MIPADCSDQPNTATWTPAAGMASDFIARAVRLQNRILRIRRAYELFTGLPLWQQRRFIKRAQRKRWVLKHVTRFACAADSKGW